MKPRLLLVASIVLCIASHNAFAESDNLSDWYAAPIVSLSINDTHRENRFGVAGGLTLGKKLSDRWNIELGGQYADFGAHDNQTSIALDGLYFFKRSDMFSPYATAGMGWVYEGPLPNHNHNVDLMLRGGLGFMTNVTKNVDFRMDARYQWHGSTHGSPGLGDCLISAGINLHF